VAGPTGKRRLHLPGWSGEIGYWWERRAERRASGPEERLALTEKRLARNLDRLGPDSWRSINAMEAVAKSREAVGRYADALPLRQQVVDRRRHLLGTEDRLTLAAEARLAVTLIELQQPDRARPLLAHVHRGLGTTNGSDDATRLAVTERLADAEVAAGNPDRARHLLEQVLDVYRRSGQELPAAATATKLAKILIRDGRYEEASELLRPVVEVRSRILGPTDPDTLASLRNLASSLVWSKEFAEASIVARNLLATTVQTQGRGHPDALDAERLVDNIARRLDAG
jgi:tetratricopeptide (TPR) repeat protein